MADTPLRLTNPTQLTTSAANVYGAAASLTIVRNIHACNNTASAVTFTMNLGTTGIDTAATRYFDAISVPANGAFDWSGFLVVPAGEYITAKAGTGTALTLTISGITT